VYIVPDPWTEPQFISRAWCLYELHACVSADAPLSVCLTEEDEEQLLRGLIDRGVDASLRPFATVNSRKTVATSPEDERKIGEAITGSVGFDALDSMVLSEMRGWLLGLVNERLDACRECGSWDEDSCWLSLRFVELLVQHEQFEAAREACTEGLRVAGGLEPDLRVLSARDRAIAYPPVFAAAAEVAAGSDEQFGSQAEDAVGAEAEEDEEAHTAANAEASLASLASALSTSSSAAAAKPRWRPNGAASFRERAYLLSVEGSPRGSFRRTGEGVLDEEHAVVLALKFSLLTTGRSDELMPAASRLRMLDELVQTHTQLSGLDAAPTLEVRAALAWATVQGDAPEKSVTTGGAALPSLQEAEAARGVYEELLPALERVLGSDHPTTLNSLRNVGLILHSALEEHSAASEVYRKIVRLQTVAAGEHHASTLASKNNLAATLIAEANAPRTSAAGRVAAAGAAREQMEDVLLGRELQLGDKHAETLSARFNLAMLLCDYDSFFDELPRAVLLLERCCAAAAHNADASEEREQYEEQLRHFKKKLSERRKEALRLEALRLAGLAVDEPSPWVKGVERGGDQPRCFFLHTESGETTLEPPPRAAGMLPPAEQEIDSSGFDAYFSAATRTQKLRAGELDGSSRWVRLALELGPSVPGAEQEREHQHKLTVVEYVDESGQTRSVQNETLRHAAVYFDASAGVMTLLPPAERVQDEIAEPEERFVLQFVQAEAYDDAKAAGPRALHKTTSEVAARIRGDALHAQNRTEVREMAGMREIGALRSSGRFDL